jgi:hypothetical protein
MFFLESIGKGYFRAGPETIVSWEELEGSKIVPSWNIDSFPSAVSFDIDHVSLK